MHFQINGKEVGTNRGGYMTFTCDITDVASFNDANDLLIFVHDPTDSGDYVLPVGKQTLREFLHRLLPRCSQHIPDARYRPEPHLLYSLQWHLAECLVGSGTLFEPRRCFGSIW